MRAIFSILVFLACTGVIYAQSGSSCVNDYITKIDFDNCRIWLHNGNNYPYIVHWPDKNDPGYNDMFNQLNGYLAWATLEAQNRDPDTRQIPNATITIDQVNSIIAIKIPVKPIPHTITYTFSPFTKSLD